MTEDFVTAVDDERPRTVIDPRGLYAYSERGRDGNPHNQLVLQYEVDGQLHELVAPTDVRHVGVTIGRLQAVADLIVMHIVVLKAVRDALEQQR